MTLTLAKGRYGARIAGNGAEIEAAQALRHAAFRRQGADTDCLDHDRFDETCTHYLIEDRISGRLVCCFRVLPLRNGAQIARSYSAQFYDLAGLSAYPGPMLELGRFCLHPDEHDPDILRVAWGALTRHVDGAGVQMLFGCSSFEGVSAAPYRDAFALLGAQHLAPLPFRPGIKAPSVVRYTQDVEGTNPDRKRGLQQLPSLLRTYLLMGGWVSDHAVVDRAMNTLHVFTGLEISAIPEPRKRLLRASAEMLDGQGAPG